jgi:hypothetical protein
MDMDIQTKAPDDYSGALYLRCPLPQTIKQHLPRAIKQAARGNMTSASVYVRQAVLSQLRLMATTRTGMPPDGALEPYRSTIAVNPSCRASRAARVPLLGGKTLAKTDGTENSPPTTPRLREPKISAEMKFIPIPKET